VLPRRKFGTGATDWQHLWTLTVLPKRGRYMNGCIRGKGHTALEAVLTALTIGQDDEE